MKWLQRWRERRRYRRVLKACGCVCYCPQCGDILNDRADLLPSDLLVTYRCPCGQISVWDFAAPAPILRVPVRTPTPSAEEER